MHQVLEGSFELSIVNVRKVIVGRDKNWHAEMRGCPEQGLKVLHGSVFRHTFADNSSRDAFGVEEVVLWVSDDDRNAFGIDHHISHHSKYALLSTEL